MPVTETLAYPIVGYVVRGAAAARSNDPTLPAPTPASAAQAVALALVISTGKTDWRDSSGTRVGLWGLKASDSPVAGGGLITVSDPTVNAQQMWKRSRGGTSWASWPEAVQIPSALSPAAAAVKRYQEGGLNLDGTTDPGSGSGRTDEILVPGEQGARDALSTIGSGISSIGDLLAMVGKIAGWFVTGGWWRILLTIAGAGVLWQALSHTGAIPGPSSAVKALK